MASVTSIAWLSLLAFACSATETVKTEQASIVGVCLGQNVTLADHVLQPSEADVISVEWIKNHGHNEEQATLLAVNISGTVLTVPGTKPTLRYIPEKGMVMAVVQPADLGLYTVRVRSVQQGALHVHTQTVRLQQQDDLPLHDNKVQTYVSADIVHDQTTNQWHMQVVCGTFLSSEEDPISVTWQTPSNQVLNSTRSEKGNFVLNVPNPVEDGIYSCFLLSSRCRNKNMASGKVGHVHVNAVEQRLRLLEAGVSAKCGVSDALQPKPELANGTVMYVAECEEGYMYSKNETSFHNGQEMGQCHKYIWTGKEANDKRVGSAGFSIPRVPDVGWSVCVTAVPTKFRRATVNLCDKEKRRIVSHFDIRMDMDSHFHQVVMIDEAIKNEIGNYDWLGGDLLHPSPYPFAVGQQFTLKTVAVEEHKLEYYINGKFLASRALQDPVRYVEIVEAFGDIVILEVNTWCD